MVAAKKETSADITEFQSGFTRGQVCVLVMAAVHGADKYL